MTPRILKVKFAEPLSKLVEQLGKSKLATEIGVSAQKLTAMIDDDWQYITRDSIERTADYLGLKAEQIFEFVPVGFWNPIERANGATFLRGSREATTSQKEFRIPWYDDQATDVVRNFLRELLPSFNQSDFADHGQDRDVLLELAKEQNFIVIGSPKSNAACEVLLSQCFGAEPFDPSEENRKKIPFGFCWQDDSPIVEMSALTCSDRARKDTKFRPGIALKTRIHVAADYNLDEAAYLESRTNKGRDCGIVFVANKPFGTSHDVKLIVLAGFSGTGTVAAATALVQDFRYLEPMGAEPYVYGVVAARYSKTAHTDHRELTDVRWKFRKGGRRPIKPDKNAEPPAIQIEPRTKKS